MADEDIRVVEGPRLRHSPVFDTLTGPTVADNERHVIARSALVRRVASDARVVELFAAWDRRLGIDEALRLWRRAAEIAEGATGQLWFDLEDGTEICVDTE